MGQTLSEPVVDKKSESGDGETFIFGTSSMQGWRISMEDAHACILDLQAAVEGGKPTEADQRLAFFGVYDGHGGDKVAIYTGEHLHEIVAKQEAFKEGDIKKALQDGFLATDRAILSDPRYEEEVSGCTASVGILSKDKIYVANSGDSRTVLGVKGRAKPLSFDHKPQNEAEKARIQAAGGFVDFGRVNGNLALSRAIGDFEFKKSADLPPEQQIVTAFPDVEIHEINADDEFLVVACDGIWDVQSSQAVIEFVRRGIVAKQDLASICENMMDNCLASNSDTGGVGCDNMTITIVGLLQGRTKEQWYEDIAKRVANGEGPSEFRGPGVHHRIDDSPDEHDMDLDHRFSPSTGTGGRIILLGDGTEIETDGADNEMFDNDDEEKDLDSQVNKFSKDDAKREGTPGPNTTEVTESPSSVATEKSEDKDTTGEKTKLETAASEK
ncbi:protein phosphatase-like protein 2c [Macroventuria anomochaeta]|uniref:Protein phosphatase-like protein 2c n=1 Tax=Macroventuria anomochaeta TaxID=301207 RepID=A0ACB6RMU0_9PLEO|nr:protein phosphatase-like protein 2c [Macroventuria anomochaeta]KAF2622239.1 protein phosphatase-like protein 2c [Macroventuria anomochaeta]